MRLVVRVEQHDSGPEIIEHRFELREVVVVVERESVRLREHVHVVAIVQPCVFERALDRALTLLKIDDQSRRRTRPRVIEHPLSLRDRRDHLQGDRRLAVPGVADDDRARTPPDERAKQRVILARLWLEHERASGDDFEPWRGLLDVVERHEIVERVARCDVIARVCVQLVELRQSQLDSCVHALQARDDRTCVLDPRLVSIGDDDHVRAREPVRVLVSPLARPAGVARRSDPERAQTLDVLFALDDVDRLASSDRVDQLGQSVRHATHVVELPTPAALRRARQQGVARSAIHAGRIPPLGR